MKGGSAGSATVCPFKCHMWTVWCCLQARRLQEEVVCVSKCSVWWRSAEHPTGPAWENKHIPSMLEKNKTEMVPCSWWKQIGRRASRWAPYGHQRAISRLYTKIHDGKTLVIRSDQPGERPRGPSSSSVLLTGLITTSRLNCASSSRLSVCPLVVRHNVFNRPLQDYIINKTLASLCFISCSHSHTHTHSHSLMRAAWKAFDETQLVNEWKTSLLTLYLFILQTRGGGGEPSCNSSEGQKEAAGCFVSLLLFSRLVQKISMIKSH